MQRVRSNSSARTPCRGRCHGRRGRTWVPPGWGFQSPGNLFRNSGPSSAPQSWGLAAHREAGGGIHRLDHSKLRVLGRQQRVPNRRPRRQQPAPAHRHGVACVDRRVCGVVVREQQLDLLQPCGSTRVTRAHTEWPCSRTARKHPPGCPAHMVAARAHKWHACHQRLRHAGPRVPTPAWGEWQGRWRPGGSPRGGLNRQASTGKTAAASKQASHLQGGCSRLVGLQVAMLGYGVAGVGALVVVGVCGGRARGRRATRLAGRAGCLVLPLPLPIPSAHPRRQKLDSNTRRPWWQPQPPLAHMSSRRR